VARILAETERAVEVLVAGLEPWAPSACDAAGRLGSGPPA
jgi:hypothetical protein